MRIKAKPVPVIMFIVLCLLMATFYGFAGFMSFFISSVLPIYAIIIIIHLFASWGAFAWHQEFSTDHPQKGETVHVRLRLSNDGFFPLAAGDCQLVMPGDNENTKLSLPIGFIPGTAKSVEYESDIYCRYRGVYIAGIDRVSFYSPFGILSTELSLTPRVFYVFPELVSLDSSVERLALSSGSTVPESGVGLTDVSVFEYTIPANEDGFRKRVNWKRWAATGIPSVIENGRTKARGLLLVLDLYSCNTNLSISADEKLAAEDIAISAVFSLINYLSSNGIPVEFQAGGIENSTLNKSVEILNKESFTKLYSKSTGIIFKDNSFPYNAFTGENSAVLITCRPVELIYPAYHKALLEGHEPHVFMCPPISQFTSEHKRCELIDEERIIHGSKTVFYVADVESGSGEISRAFCS